MFQVDGYTAPATELDEAQVQRVTAPNSPAFADFLLMLSLLKDPNGFQAKLDQLIAATVKANEARTVMIRQQSANTARENEFEAWQKQLAERFMAVQQAEAQASERQSRLLAIAADIRRTTDQFKREALKYGGYVDINEKLSGLPDWPALAQMVLGERNDMHFDGNQGSAREQDDPAETLPLEGRVPGSSITQSVSRKRPRRGS
jgi:hypothetical protein